MNVGVVLAVFSLQDVAKFPLSLPIHSFRLFSKPILESGNQTGFKNIQGRIK
jgi:hypothetical protein